MSPRRPGWPAIVDAALAELTFHTGSRLGHRLTVSTGVRVPLSVEIEREWATLQCAVTPEAENVAPWDVLRLNGELPGDARLVIVPGQTRVAARADVALMEGVPGAVRGQAAWAGLRAAAQLCGRFMRAARRARPVDERADPTAPLCSGLVRAVAPAGAVLRILPATARPSGRPRSPAADDNLPDLGAVLAAIGWRFVQRSATRYAVDLGVRGQLVQAIVEPMGAGQVRLRAVLATIRSPLAITRAAVGVLLLTTSAAMRLVRSGVDEDADDSAIYIETWFHADGPAEELQHALSALAVASQMVAREARALADERVAREYLARRGWDVPPA